MMEASIAEADDFIRAEGTEIVIKSSEQADEK